MSVYRVTLFLFLLFSFVQPTPALAQARENIVLLPVEVSPEYVNQKKLIGVALQQSLSKNFNVFYGDSVESALQAEYAKEDCSAESCVQNIAILFNGEIVVDASVQRVENSVFLSVQLRNVITGELEAVVQDACENCSFNELVKFIKLRTDNIQLKPSDGLSALLKNEPEPDEETITGPIAQTPEQAIALMKRPAKIEQARVQSPSYWKWGLGAVVLGAAGGGGGGGGGGGSEGDSGELERTLLVQNLSDQSQTAFSQSSFTTRDLLDGSVISRMDWNTTHSQIAVQMNEYNSSTGAVRYVDESVSTGAHLFYLQATNGDLGWICVDCSDDLYDDDIGLYTDQMNNIINMSWQQSEDGNVITHYGKRVNQKNYTVFFSTPGNAIDYAVFGFSDQSQDSQAFDKNIRTIVYGNATSRLSDGTTPASGDFTLNGWSIGRFIAGMPSRVVSASVELNVNYTNSTFDIDFTNTRSNEASLYPALDFSITGNVNGTALNRTSITRPVMFSSDFGGIGFSAQAFGPNAENYAGSFSFNQVGLIYIGAFGVER